MGIKTVAIHSDVDASSVSISLLSFRQDLIWFHQARNERISALFFLHLQKVYSILKTI